MPSSSQPSVVARGSWVYAVYEVPLMIAQVSNNPQQAGAGMGSGIYYRQLQGGRRAGKVLVDMNYQARTWQLPVILEEQFGSIRLPH